jgi:hypothetical protein
MPESIALHSLDPGMRRDGEKRINQWLLIELLLFIEVFWRIDGGHE